MNTNITNDRVNEGYSNQGKETDWLELIRKIHASGKLILRVCGIGTIIGVVIALGTPKEYTASTLIVPEGYSRGASSGISALANMADINIGSSPSTERDAIYPSLYPDIVNSLPFLTQLFNVKVCRQKDDTAMTLAQYLKDHQKAPWWSAITSAPFRLLSLTTSLFKKTSKAEKTKDKIDIFQLTREEAGIAGAIASRITVGVDKKKRVITLFVTMQDPLVAATVTDSVRARLKDYITNYRTAKARRNLEYTEKMRLKSLTEYRKAQEKYTLYADANRELARQSSRAELIRLRNEMELALNIYNLTEQQLQAAKAKVEREKPVYAVIQPVQVPLNPSKPRSMLIIAGYILLSAAGSIVWVLFGKDFFKAIRRARIRRRAGEKDTKTDD